MTNKPNNDDQENNEVEETSEFKIEFAPGCFDEFDGTQEELDAFIKEITDLVHSGELFENSVPVDLDDLSPEEREAIIQGMESVNLDGLECYESKDNGRKLH